MNCKYDAHIDALLKKMSLHEKIGQLNQITLFGEDIEVHKEAIRKGEVGSIILASSATAGNDPQSCVDVELYQELQRVAVEESPNGIPMIFGRDVIHGHRTVYPIPLASAASFDGELVKKCYRDIAQEAANDSIHWTFAPMLDLSRDPRWGRIIEGPGEDPFLGAYMAKAQVKGFQGEDVADKDSLVACAKHFIGYGASESGRDYHRTEISDYSLYNDYLPAFRAAVDAGVGTVMSSFNPINGRFVQTTPKYLTDILRGHMGFEGFTVADWGVVTRALRFGQAASEAECAATSINAGLDMDMVVRGYIKHLEAAVEKGEVEEETVDRAVRRVLRVKFAKGLFDRPYCERRTVDFAAHLQNARTLAADCMVLLKNDGTLPLKKEQAVLLTGPFIRERRALLGSWTLNGLTEETPNLLEAMQEVLGNKVKYNADEISVYDSTLMQAEEADVVVLALGESHNMTGERRCVADISLDAAQVELIKKAKTSGKKVVGVFFCGRPMALEGVTDLLDAALYAWHGGSQTARATCDVLFGDVVPSGKLPMTFPRKTGQIPLYYNVVATGMNYYGEGYNQCYVDSMGSPLYPFGFGLSYTTFAYAAPQTDTNSISLEELKGGAAFHVSVTVTNTGALDAKETVQLYVRDKVAMLLRPMRELKGFEKTLIKAGETKTLTFTVGHEQLGFYTEDGEYTVEAGEFEIYVGGDSLTKNSLTVKVI